MVEVVLDGLGGGRMGDNAMQNAGMDVVKLFSVFPPPARQHDSTIAGLQCSIIAARVSPMSANNRKQCEGPPDIPPHLTWTTREGYYYVRGSEGGMHPGALLGSPSTAGRGTWATP